ncbi:hypothetical protein [Actinomycetospora aeridis]|uniref:Uncharacterized protein n=1 Tax=Actinomycetospora aeridis TaxID=3129231 RepID=A0ABU8N4G3_9PSEU
MPPPPEEPDAETESDEVAAERAREIAVDVELKDVDRAPPALDPETEQALRDRLT